MPGEPANRHGRATAWTYLHDFVSQFVGRLDTGDGDAAYAYASLSGSPVDLLAGNDGAIYLLTLSVIARISAP